MTNDFLFKYLLQSDTNVLKWLVCSYLSLNPDDVHDIFVTNPIDIGIDLDSKEMILDVKASLNDNTIINLEMQVINHYDWPERSISYLCRCYDNLSKGTSYKYVKGAVHIGFLDYTLFPDSPEFFSTYELANNKTGRKYSGKFRLHVVDLTLIERANDNDILYHRDIWARFFKARTWEELYMLAEKDEHIKEAVVRVAVLSEEEKLRMQMEAREDRIRQEMDFMDHFESQIKEQKEQLEKQASQLDAYRKKLIEAGIDPDTI